MNQSPQHVETLILRRLTAVTQESVAPKIGLSETQLSKIVNGSAGLKMSKLGNFFKALGLQLVESNGSGGTVTITGKEYQALKNLAGLYLQQTHESDEHD